MKLALNIGCGEVDFRESTLDTKWVNIDGRTGIRADLCDFVDRLDREYEGKVDEIVANDILEHMTYSDKNRDGWKMVLASWVKCLKSGGKIRVQVPCMDAIFALYMNESMDEDMANRVIYGENTGWFDRHYQLFTLPRLVKAMEDCGLEIVSTEFLHICVIVVGRKK